ncbi:MAG: energy-coupling factor ABC transporter permease [Jatrophihabitans sp.]
MHIPDGFVNVPTTVAGGAVAVAGIALCVRKTSKIVVDRQLPAAGLAAAFFLLLDAPLVPITVGTSGHLLGGTLAATLLGPWLGVLVVTVVTVVQAVFAGDGGVSALGVNIVNLAIVPAAVGYPLAALLRRLLPRSATGVAIAAGFAAVVAVITAALLLGGEYAVGGAAGIPTHTVVSSTLGVYSVVALVEGVVTGLVIRTLYTVRPDLVWLARPLRVRRPEPEPELDPTPEPVDDR